MWDQGIEDDVRLFWGEWASLGRGGGELAKSRLQQFDHELHVTCRVRHRTQVLQPCGDACQLFRDCLRLNLAKPGAGPELDRQC